MKKYHCDGGSIMIGTKDLRFCLPNGYGDGSFSIEIIKTKKQKEKFYKAIDKWKWLGTVEGNEINIYVYDCLTQKEIEEIKSNVLYTLNGRFGVYRNNGKIILEKW